MKVLILNSGIGRRMGSLTESSPKCLVTISEKDTILAFYDELKKKGINVTIRREFGGNVSAACGQLRSNYKEE